MSILNVEQIAPIHDTDEAEAFLFSQIGPSDAMARALKLAHDSHKDQFRKSGEPYVVHPILVASIVANITEDEAMVIAALLHDVIEDTDTPIEQIEADFGHDIAHLVQGLTKIDSIRDAQLIPSYSDQKLIISALTFRKMLIASIEDVRVLVVKLCDRLHNMLTLDALLPAKQRRISEETLVVYAPIAQRLGISFLKNQLEDLSFKYLFQDEREEIEEYLDVNYHSIRIKLHNFIERLRQMMLESGLNEDEFEIVSRIKHNYSIYLKMQRKGVGIDEILDLLALRIIVKKPLLCYRVLGLVHLNFQPISSRFKDYIAIPKENGYQTLHTTVFYESGIYEIQIRTFEMHNTAELGVAAHWKYKSGGNNAVNLEWLNNLQYQSDNVEEFYELIKNDLYSDEITVFSPEGRPFALPRGAVALDFAYSIHTEVGNRAESVFIDNEKASLIRELHNGDMVQIFTGDKTITRCSWIDVVKTSRAKSNIRANCNQRLRAIDSQTAKNILRHIFSMGIIRAQEMIDSLDIADQLHRVPQELDMLKEVMNRFVMELGGHKRRFSGFLLRKRYKLKSYEFSNIEVISNSSVNDMMFDYCCHPKTGDEIVGFIQDSKVYVHHKMCKNAISMIEEHQPMVYVRWRAQQFYGYRLIISMQSTQGALAELLTYMAKMGADIQSIELGKEKSEHTRFCEMEFEALEGDINKLRTKIEKKGKIIQFFRTDDAYRTQG